MTAVEKLSSRDWFGKASAGLLLGFTLAIGASGLLGWALGVDDLYFSTKAQVTMWLISPVWCVVLCFCFLFRSGLSAWGWLSLGNAFVWGLLIMSPRL